MTADTDSGYGQAVSYGGEAYLVLQVVLTEKFLGTGSGVSSLSNLQNVINEQAAKGYRLHTITTASYGFVFKVKRCTESSTARLSSESAAGRSDGLWSAGRSGGLRTAGVRTAGK